MTDFEHVFNSRGGGATCLVPTDNRSSVLTTRISASRKEWRHCYHGCLEPVATNLVGGQLAIRDWRPSKNRYDWLGEGIYFWEHDPGRAMTWALKKAQEEGEEDSQLQVNR